MQKDFAANMDPNADFDPYVELANAIVAQAVEDYTCELAKLELNPKNGPAALEVHRLEKFFHSDWYAMLTNLNPDYLMEGARILAKKEAEEMRVRATRKRIRECVMAANKILDGLEEQDELSPEQQEEVKKFCLEALDLTEEIPLMQAEEKKYESMAAQRMNLRTGA